MCDSEASADCSTSISVGERAKLDERKKPVRQIQVCQVSDDESSPLPGSRRRLVFGKDSLEPPQLRLRTYKLRAKIQGAERFNPFQETPAELERKKQRRLEKRRRELEDDAGSRPEGAGDNNADVDKLTSPSSSLLKNKAAEEAGPQKKTRKSDGKPHNFLMLKANEGALRSTSSLPIPGTGRKKNWSRSFQSTPVAARGGSTARVTRAAAAWVSVPVSSDPPIQNLNPALDCSKVFRGFHQDFDESTLKKLRGRFSLPFLSRRASEGEPDKGESDDDSSPNVVATVPAPNHPDENEFNSKLKIQLSKPFSYNELHSLMSSAKRQTPVLKSLELRGQRSVKMCTDKEGYSYLDRHPGLAKALRLADHAEEKLRLLRGFFFWIGHACMEGSFRPWEPKEDIILIDD